MLEQRNASFEQFKSDSAAVDSQLGPLPAEQFRSYHLMLPVPAHHARAASITDTEFLVGAISSQQFPEGSHYLVDSGLRNSAEGSLPGVAHYIEPAEDTLKELAWLNQFMETEVPNAPTAVIGIGGGVLLNAAAYIAERRNVDFISVPTTVLAAADSAIGGLVRINKVTGDQVQKSFYRSVYEPSKIILDPTVLATLPRNQISLGLSEVIKHGVYQSSTLLAYLAGDGFDPFNNPDSLLKAICWTVALKNVAIIHDPDSESFGSDVLRGGHKLALGIEERSHFVVSHGAAVAVGVYQDTLGEAQMQSPLDIIYEKLGLPKSENDLDIKQIS